MTDDGGRGPDEGLAPVIPLFGSRGRAHAVSPRKPDVAPESGRAGEPGRGDARIDEGPAGWHATWGASVTAAVEPSRSRARESGPVDGSSVSDPTAQREAAENALLRKLRARPLSVGEARSVLAQHDLCRDDIDAVLDDFVRRGYLDDAALAEQLVHIGVDRKGQGRQAVAMVLAKRGIPRDVAERALTAMPDDDVRALEYAASKARSMRSLDRETALRRLSGQLVRRGYSSAVALTAARAALGEPSQDPASGVRFV